MAKNKGPKMKAERKLKHSSVFLFLAFLFLAVSSQRQLLRSDQGRRKCDEPRGNRHLPIHFDRPYVNKLPI
jgi:hypothetical protein